MDPVANPDVARARELLEKSRPALHDRSDRMLAAAQVHATLAVEQAVRDLIDGLETHRDLENPFQP